MATDGNIGTFILVYKNGGGKGESPDQRLNQSAENMAWEAFKKFGYNDSRIFDDARINNKCVTPDFWAFPTLINAKQFIDCVIAERKKPAYIVKKTFQKSPELVYGGLAVAGIAAYFLFFKKKKRGKK